MKQLLIFLLLILLSFACQKAEVEIPDTGRKLVINGLITTDSLLNVLISKSNYAVGLNLDSRFYLFDSADVSIYSNNTFLDSLHYWSTDYKYYSHNYVYPLSNYRFGNAYPIPGNEYKIIVKKQGYPDATATTIIPRLVKIEKVDTSRTIVDAFYGLTFDMNCKIEFTDPPREKNFYLINMVAVRNQKHEYMYFESKDPIIEEELPSHSSRGNYILTYGYAFSDKLIDGKKYSLNVSFASNFYKNCTIYFRLLSITEDYFKFIQTLNLFNATYEDPLSEPVMVYSNVSDGYGIFSGAAVSTDSIIFHTK